MKKLSLVLLFAVLVNVVSAEVVKTVQNLLAGQLSTVLTQTEKQSVTRLTVTGTIDLRDFICMRNEMGSLTDVDLSKTRIQSYSGAQGQNESDEIPAGAFSYKKLLTSFKFPEYATKIGNDAFKGCESLQSVKLDSCISEIGYSAFEQCWGLTSVTLSDMLQSIKGSAFSGCMNLTGTLMVPDNVTKILDYAFYGCSKLTGVVFGTSLDSIGGESFRYCTSLKTIRFMGTKDVTVSPYSFSSIASDATIYVPASCSHNLLNYIPLDPAFPPVYEYRARIKAGTMKQTTFTSVTLTASIDFITDSPVLNYGFTWAPKGGSLHPDSCVFNGSTTNLGAFSNTISTFTPGETYYIRAFVTDVYGTFYDGVFVYTAPILPSGTGVISGLTAVAQGQTNVTYVVSGISNASTYVWSLPTGMTGSSSSSIIKVSFAKTAVSGRISVFGRNQYGDGPVSTLAITVNPIPKDAGKITGYSAVCQGETQVNYTVPTIEYATSYVWTLPTGVTGTSSTNTILVDYGKSAVSGNVSVKGQNSFGVGTASSLGVVVHQLPVIELRDTALTFAGTALLKPTIRYSEAGPLKYKWTPFLNLDNDTILNPTVTAKGVTTYTLTVVTPNGCTASKEVTIRTKTMDKPTLGIVGIVNGKNRLAWNKVASQGIAAFQIYRETTVSDVYEKLDSVPYDSLSVFVDEKSLPDVKSNKYTISILDKGGMESLPSDPHKTIHLAINRGLNGSWNLIWEGYEGFKPLTYNIYRGTTSTSLNFLDATSASSSHYTDLEAPAGNVYYQMEVISPNLVGPSKQPSLLRSTSATYNSSRSNVAVGMLNGLKDVHATLQMYPNPMKEYLTLELDGVNSYEILNVTGRLVAKGSLSGSAMVNTSSFAPGLYVVKIHVGNECIVRKVMKAD